MKTARLGKGTVAQYGSAGAASWCAQCWSLHTNQPKQIIRLLRSSECTIHLCFNPVCALTSCIARPVCVNAVRQRTKCDRLEDVRALNLWGHDIADASLVSQMPNAEVLSLSVNKLTTLKPFSYCSRLKELYLRRNNIADLDEVAYLKPLRQLRVLWLSDNPIAHHPTYRRLVASTVPSLQKLDNLEITDEEREEPPVHSTELDAGMHADEAERAHPQLNALAAQGDAVAPSYVDDTPQRNQAPPSARQQVSSPRQSVYTPPQAGPPPAEHQVRQEKQFENPPTLNPGSSVATTPQVQRQTQQQATQGGAGGVQHNGTNDAMLYAAMSLLPVMDQESLALVRNEAERLIEQR